MKYEVEWNSKLIRQVKWDIHMGIMRPAWDKNDFESETNENDVGFL